MSKLVETWHINYPNSEPFKIATVLPKQLILTMALFVPVKLFQIRVSNLWIETVFGLSVDRKTDSDFVTKSKKSDKNLIKKVKPILLAFTYDVNTFKYYEIIHDDSQNGDVY